MLQSNNSKKLTQQVQQLLPQNHITIQRFQDTLRSNIRKPHSNISNKTNTVLLSHPKPNNYSRKKEELHIPGYKILQIIPASPTCQIKRKIISAYKTKGPPQDTKDQYFDNQYFIYIYKTSTNLTKQKEKKTTYKIHQLVPKQKPSNKLRTETNSSQLLTSIQKRKEQKNT